MSKQIREALAQRIEKERKKEREAQKKAWEQKTVKELKELINKANATLKKIENKKYPTEIKVKNQIEEIKVKNLKEINNLKVKVENLKEVDDLKVEVKNPVKKVEIEKPKWWKAFDQDGMAMKVIKGMMRVVKETVMKINADRHTIPKNALAVKVVDEKGRYVNFLEQIMQISQGGGGGSEIDTSGLNQETTQQQVLSELQTLNNAINVYVDNETPSGAIDGVNKEYETYYNYKPNTTKLFLNGIRQKEGEDYTEDGTNKITFTDAPENGDTIIIDYIKN